MLYTFRFLGGGPFPGNKKGVPSVVKKNMELEYSSVEAAFAPMRVPDLGQSRYAGNADVPFADLEGADFLSFSPFDGGAVSSASSSFSSGPSLSAPPVWRAAQPSRQAMAWSDEARAGLDGVAGAPSGAGFFVAKESLVPSAPRYDSSGGNAPSGAYDAASLYSDDSRISCSDCRWVLEDRDWCCKHDCNDKTSPHYRQAYVCADPSDKTGRLTSRCEVETECSKSEPPVMCDTTRLGELQRFNSTNDPSCAVRPTPAPDAAPWATRSPDAAPWATRSPDAAPWATGAPDSSWR
jgi:hypothetical protein